MTSKIVFLGENASGKTSILQRYINKRFCHYQEPTIGASFVSFNSTIQDRKLTFQIWDTAGQERYQSLASMYYRGSDYAIIVFDMSLKNSFDSVEKWMKELDENKPGCKRIIVGNKVDLKIAVNQYSVAEYMNQRNLEYFEVSAKTGENVDLLFNYIINLGFKNKEINENNSFSIKLETEKDRDHCISKNSCCY